MYFWRDQELALKLGEGKVSEKEKFFYYFLSVTLAYNLIYLFYAFYGSEPEGFATSTELVSCAISMVGTIICYGTNAKHDGVNFIERIIVLSLPIAIRLLVYSTIFHVFFKSANASTIIGCVYYYHRLNKAIKIAATCKVKDRKKS